ncbi:unnamed protein product [Nyctereutes procyonoides]|uniref:(raccoon dog) hypothetical protein n=1 Tax=Nyctereutes procyonoides TaxID=34880 RepID=A0A811YBW6_NYCPR|nr:unnamed protein product [Nyctereutes procyonoides]
MSVKLFELLEDVNKHQSRSLLNRRTRAAGPRGVPGNLRSTRSRVGAASSAQANLPADSSARAGKTRRLWPPKGRGRPRPTQWSSASLDKRPERRSQDALFERGSRRLGCEPVRGSVRRGRRLRTWPRTGAAARSARVKAALEPTLIPDQRGASSGLRFRQHLRLVLGTPAATPSLPGLSSLAQLGHPPELTSNTTGEGRLGLRPSPDEAEDQAPATQRCGCAPPLAAGRPTPAPPTDLITLPAHQQPVLQFPHSHLEDSNARLTAGSPASPSELNVTKDCALPPRGAHRVAATGLRSALHPHPFP